MEKEKSLALAAQERKEMQEKKLRAQQSCQRKRQAGSFFWCQVRVSIDFNQGQLGLRLLHSKYIIDFIRIHRSFLPFEVWKGET